MTVYLIIFISMAIADLILFGLSRRRGESGMRFSWVVLAAAAVNISYAIAVFTRNPGIATGFYSIYFASVTMVCVLLLKYVAEFTGFRLGESADKLVPRMVIVFTIVDLLADLTNPFTGHMTSLTHVHVFPYTSYGFEGKFYFPIHLVYCYLILAISVAILIYKSIRTPRIYRIRYLGIVVVIAVVAVLNGLYLLGNALFSVDISVLTYTITAVGIYIDTFLTLPDRLLNRTRAYIANTAMSPVVVFDHEDVLIYLNEPASQVFNKHKVTKTASYELATFSDFVKEYEFDEKTVNGVPFEYNVDIDDAHHTFRGSVQVMKDKAGRPIARLIALNDITYERDTVTGFDLIKSMQTYLGNLRQEDIPLQIAVMNISGLSVINRAFSHANGDEIMKMLANAIRIYFDVKCHIAKMDDGTLIVAVPNLSADDVTDRAMSVRNLLMGDNKLGVPIEVEYGVATINSMDEPPVLAIDEALQIMSNKKLLGTQSRASALINSLTQSLLESDYETEEHVMRTRAASILLSRELGLPEKVAGQLELLCILHDIGKLGIPYEILSKAEKLNDTEWAVMKTHCERGYRIALASPDLEPIAIYIRHHHERWDGTGYPAGMKGNAIPYLSRVMTVLDSFDVMTHDRPYHKAISVDAAKVEMLKCKGTQFDPDVVDAFMKIVDKVEYQ